MCLWVYLHHKCVYYVLLRQEPVVHLLLLHDWPKVELTQVLLQEGRHLRHVRLHHAPQTRGSCALEGVTERVNERLSE